MRSLIRRLSKPKAFPAALAVVVVGSFLALAWATIPDYGPHWDIGEYELGDRYFYFFKSLDRRQLNMQENTVPLYRRADHPDYFKLTDYYRKRAHWTWPLSFTVSAVSKHVLFTWLGVLGPIDAQHAVLPLLAALLAAVLFLFVRRVAGPWEAVIALLCLLSHPRFWSHVHYNVKDISACVMFSVVAIAFHRAVRDRNFRAMLGFGVLFGLALATRPNAMLLPFVLGPYLLHVLVRRRRARELLLGRRTWGALAACPLIGAALWFAAWPYMWIDFPDNVLRHLGYVQTMSTGGNVYSEVLFGSRSWNLVPPVLAVVTTPVVVLGLLLLGLGPMAVRAVKQRRLEPVHLLLLLWLVVPVLRAALPMTRDYDGIRHWLEYVPAVAVLAGIGGAAVVRRALGRLGLQPESGRGRALALGLVGLCFGPVVAWNVRNHPNQVAYFNTLIGGLGGAQRMGLPHATDYWGVSYRQGMRWLNEHARRGSLLMVAIADHLVEMPRGLWLRKDIAIQNISGLFPAKYPPLLADLEPLYVSWPGEVYVMYFTHRRQYRPWIRQLDRRHRPVHQITVDGGVILKILRIKEQGQAPASNSLRLKGRTR